MSNHNHIHDIVNDLLPLYAEGMTSEASNKVIERHLKICKECQDCLEDLKPGSSDIFKTPSVETEESVKQEEDTEEPHQVEEAEILSEVEDTAKDEEVKNSILNKFSKKLNKKNMRDLIAITCCVLVLVLAVFTAIQPTRLSNEQAVKDVYQDGENIVFELSDNVAGYQIDYDEASNITAISAWGFGQTHQPAVNRPPKDTVRVPAKGIVGYSAFNGTETKEFYDDGTSDVAGSVIYGGLLNGLTVQYVALFGIMLLLGAGLAYLIYKLITRRGRKHE